MVLMFIFLVSKTGFVLGKLRRLFNSIAARDNKVDCRGVVGEISGAYLCQCT